MKVGLLLCDHVADKFQQFAGDYPEMFGSWLKGWDLEFFDCVNGEFPSSPDACDAFMATGSRYSAYDDLEWIGRLKNFIRQLSEEQIPFIGICFGHQVLAEALGGKVEKATTGWGVGILPIKIVTPEQWMNPQVSEISLHYMHQDQVTELPANGRILASSAHCPVAGIAVGENMIGIQAHPEFVSSYSEALLRDRVGRIGEATVTAALETLTRSTDSETVRFWCENFLNSKTVAR